MVLKKNLTILVFLFACVYAKSYTAKEIVEKSYQQTRSDKNFMTIIMTIIRPTWERTMEMKSWSMGNDYSLIRIDRPAKNKGMATLKIKKEAWSYIPRIERAIKISSSQMSQSWMGSDFTNEDLLREASIVHDYIHKILRIENEKINPIYVIQFTPKENAPVVWGKIISWYDREKLVAIRSEFYDEENILVNTMEMSNIKKIANRYLPTKQEIIPQAKPGQKTTIEIKKIDFSVKLSPSFFSIQNLNKIR